MPSQFSSVHLGNDRKPLSLAIGDQFACRQLLPTTSTVTFGTFPTEYRTGCLLSAVHRRLRWTARYD